MLTVHLVGLAFGFGGATVADISFVRAVRKGDRITAETVIWMRSFSALVWIGLAILTVSGIGLFFTNPSLYRHMPGFQAKMILVLVLIVNGLFLNFYSTGKLTTFDFSTAYSGRDAAWQTRKLSFIFGAISITTWYATLMVSMFKTLLHLSVLEYVLIYLAILAAAVTGSLLVDHLVHRKLRKGR